MYVHNAKLIFFVKHVGNTVNLNFQVVKPISWVRLRIIRIQVQELF